MGMTLDEKCYLYGSCKCQTAGCVVRPDNGCPVYIYFKDLIVKDYETRLKADMAAMLTDIQLEIEEEKTNTEHLHYDDLEHAESYNIGVDNCSDIIQQKINSLNQKVKDEETDKEGEKK